MPKQQIFNAIPVLASVFIAFLLSACATNENVGRATNISSPVEGNSTPLKKIQITPATNSIAHAMYYDSVGKRIEKIGTQRFPKEGGKSIYGSLIIWIPILRDGSIYESEGGPRIERSSGNKQLDMAALEIVRAAAPFGRFPSPHGKAAEEEVWELRFPFDFKNENDPHNSTVNPDAASAPR